MAAAKRETKAWRLRIGSGCLALAALFAVLASRGPCAPRDVRVGVYQNRPKVFVDEEGKPAGFFIDLLEEIALREHWNLIYSPCEWPECLAALEEGRIDLMPDVAFSEERAAKFDFHRIPAAESWSFVYASRRKSIQRLSDLNGLRIAVLKGSVQQEYFEQMVKGFGLQARIVPVDTMEQGFALAASGSVDAAAANHFFGNHYCGKYRLEKTPLVFNAVNLYFAAPRGKNSDLLRAIDTHLGAWIKESRSPYYTLLYRWMEPPPPYQVPRALLWFLGGIAGLVLFAAAMIHVLRQQVRLRTRGLVKANEELKKTEETLRLAMEATREGIWDWYPATGALFWSPRSYALLGYQAGEFPMSLERWSGLLHPEDREVFLAALRGLSPDNPGFFLDLRYQRKEGGWTWIHCRGKAVEFDGSGVILRVIGTHTDITERKSAEEERERLQAQYLQAAKMESIGQLAGGVAHDFNNMLQTILACSELALAEAPPATPLREYLQDTIKAAEQSANLTRQLLAFARRQNIAPRVLDLNDAVTDALKMLRRLIGEGIQLTWKPAASPWVVKMDPAQVVQILANLCVNARDAISGTGTIEIATENVHLDKTAGPDAAPGEYVALSVTDDGCGMESGVIEKIFEPFFTTKEPGRGTGLGLAMVYGIVRQNNGWIDVRSAPGKGTKFVIYLPRFVGPPGGAEEAGAAPAPAEPPKGNGETILLVEDEPGILDSLRSLLAKLGYRVLTAATSGDAIRQAKSYSGEIHLLVADVVMPEMNGQELAREIRRVRPGIKRLFISGHAAESIFPPEGPGEPACCLQKPFSITELAIRLRQILNPVNRTGGVNVENAGGAEKPPMSF